jgi:hypothetical protein
MKELYVEVLAKHNGHESCADDREVVREAFDSGMYRLGIEPRKALIRVSTLFRQMEDNTRNIATRDVPRLCVVGDPIHVQKLYARESGDPTIDLNH